MKERENFAPDIIADGILLRKLYFLFDYVVIRISPLITFGIAKILHNLLNTCQNNKTVCTAFRLLFYLPHFRIQPAGLDLKHNNMALFLKCTAAIAVQSWRCKMKRRHSERYTNIDLPLNKT